MQNKSDFGEHREKSQVHERGSRADDPTTRRIDAMGGGDSGGGGSFAGSRYGFTTAQEYGNHSLSEYPSTSEEKPKVFISYQYEDVAQARLLGYQLEAKQYGVGAEDVSPKEPYPGNWRVPMSATIGGSDVVLVPIGPGTHSSEAVRWEIREAQRTGKPVYGVQISRDQSYPAPPELYAAGGTVLPWNLNTINTVVTTAAANT
ncbi:MAG: TIR domain-containing protein [Candidatus Micrarchaeota archaeon]